METEISYIALRTHSVRLAADSSLHAALSKRVGASAGRKPLKKREWRNSRCATPLENALSYIR